MLGGWRFNPDLLCCFLRLEDGLKGRTLKNTKTKVICGNPAVRYHLECLPIEVRTFNGV